MAALVRDQGWTLIHLNGTAHYQAAASIEKSGVAFGYAFDRGDQDFNVYLKSDPHPPVNTEVLRSPSLPEILDAIGVKYDFQTIFIDAANFLPEIKRVLSHPAIWDYRVRRGAEDLLSRYNSWRTGPDFTRDIAESLANRYPWLRTGKVPQELSRVPAARAIRLPLGWLIGVIGIGCVVARYVT